MVADPAPAAHSAGRRDGRPDRRGRPGPQPPRGAGRALRAPNSDLRPAPRTSRGSGRRRHARPARFATSTRRPTRGSARSHRRRRRHDDGFVRRAAAVAARRCAFVGAAADHAVDYDMCVPAETARGAHRLFLTDDVGQLLATRPDDVFAGYPDPDAHHRPGAARSGTARETQRPGVREPPRRWPRRCRLCHGDRSQRALSAGIGIELPR